MWIKFPQKRHVLALCGPQMIEKWLGIFPEPKNEETASLLYFLTMDISTIDKLSRGSGEARNMDRKYENEIQLERMLQVCLGQNNQKQRDFVWGRTQ